MKYSNAIATVRKQEELLQFETFSHKDAWDLGMIMADEAANCGFESTIVSIRLSNGANVFQYMSGNCAPVSDKWITRKESTVAMTGHASILIHLNTENLGTTIEDEGLDPIDETIYGGGFPIVVKGTGIVGVALCSGLEQDTREHNLLVKSLSRYLNVEVPVWDSEEPYTK